MNIREALQQQSPSLALQRAAADEIAKLDASIRQYNTILSLRAAIIEQAHSQLNWIQKHHPGIYAKSTFWDQS